MDLKLSIEAQHDWNLRVLQRRDPAISRIVGSACFVSLYTFDTGARTCETVFMRLRLALLLD